MAGGKKGCLVIFIIVGVSILLLCPSVQKTRGRLNALHEEVTATWSHIDETFQRRVDLIPNLVETVKLYAPHEEEVFGTLTRLQLKVATRMPLPAKIAANNDLTAALNQLLMMAERYPDLKADPTFILLQGKLADTENRIAEGRMRYNEAVREYNSYSQKFPTVFVAAVFGFNKIPILDAPE
ncbi:MAG: LemA family protein [Deltaproteobacteria bacterium]|nr:LemA family protein [Deltaproteobacteria bacterium]